jgi:acetyl esterase/lipase
MGDMVSLPGGVGDGMAFILVLPALLAFFKPPTYRLWKLSIVVREGGHWMALPCLALAAAAFLTGPSGRFAGMLFLAAAILYGLTLVRACITAVFLERRFRAGWGSVAPGAGGFRRRKPIVFSDLFRGIRIDRFDPEAYVYAHRGDLELGLDFFRARGRRDKAPCVLLIHGGGWDGGSRADFRDLNLFLASQGYAVASMGYRLSPRFKYPAPVDDARSALAWLKTHAGELGIDPERLVLAGRSAGGQIAMQTAYLDRDPSVRGVLAFYAPANMVLAYHYPGNPLILDSRKLIVNYLGGEGEAGLSLAVASSPLETLAAGAPPTLLLHGRPDVLVTFHHVEHMREKLERLGVKRFEVDLPWAPHGYDYVFRGPGSQISLYFIERFLAAVTSVPPRVTGVPSDGPAGDAG